MRLYYYLLFLLIPFTASSQTKQIITYYDFGKTRVYQQYTALNKPPYLKHGLYKEFDQSGFLLEVSNYSNGMLNGNRKVYQENSQGKDLKHDYNYLNGKEHGVCKNYDYTDKGKLVLTAEFVYENGKEIAKKTYSENGILTKDWHKTGTDNEWYENGSKKQQASLKNGFSDGSFLTWYENGNPKEKGTFKNDWYYGQWSWYNENGTLQKEKYYDEKTGYPIIIKQYDDNGNLTTEAHVIDSTKNIYSEITYKDNIKVKEQTAKVPLGSETYWSEPSSGLSVGYYSNGSKKEESYYQDGSLNGKYLAYFSNGKVKKEGTYNSGKMVGEWKSFAENGNVSELTTYDDEGNTQGLHILYYENGKKSKEEYLVENSRYGDYQEWFSNGNIKVKGTYNKYSDKIGEWIFNDSLGNQTSYYTIANGEYEGKFKGELKGRFAEGQYSNGKQVGKWKYTDMKGNILLEAEYCEDGSENGIWLEYNKNGILDNRLIYECGRLVRVSNRYDLDQERIQGKINKYEEIYGQKSDYPKGKAIYTQSLLLMGYKQSNMSEKLKDPELEKLLDYLISVQNEDLKDLNKKLKKCTSREEIKAVLLP